MEYVSRRYLECSNGRGCLWRTLMMLLAATAVAGLVAEIVLADESPVSAGNSLDWHQWRGPQRNGISSETGWQAKWPAGGPRQLWQKVIGSGFSTVSVADGRVFAMGNDGKHDTIWCLDTDTGAEIWKHSYPCRKGDHPGPRATPTVDGKFVYAVSRQSDVHCLEVATGKPIWSKNLAKEVGAKVPGWGIASSPLRTATYSSSIFSSLATHDDANYYEDGSDYLWRRCCFLKQDDAEKQHQRKGQTHVRISVTQFESPQSGDP